MITHIKNQGFTLMETMVYIALFALLMSGAVVGAYNLLEGSNRNVAATGIQEEGVFLNRKINWALTGASNATVSPSGDTITITRTDLAAQSPLVISGVNGKMTIARGIGTPMQLNSDRYTVSDVVFSYTASVNGRPPSVSVSFLIEDKPFNFRTYLRE
jgi:prepilin-type N-terminal cleavage/methylation domain-containing protein